MATFKKFLQGTFIILMALTLFSFELPAGWRKAGSKPASYDMGVEPDSGLDGKRAATIKSLEPEINGFGTLMQSCLPEKFYGKRVRMTAMVKTKDVAEWAGLWFRIDQKGLKQAVSFDNMRDGKTDRSIKGTTDWKRYEIVLDVPLKATNMAYGALLEGTGQIWFDKVKFEIVDTTVPTTGKPNDSVVPLEEPVNLDFED